jgi:hypothetical protein
MDYVLSIVILLFLFFYSTGSAQVSAAELEQVITLPGLAASVKENYTKGLENQKKAWEALQVLAMIGLLLNLGRMFFAIYFTAKRFMAK